MNTLLIDLETFPQLAWTWTSWETNVIAVKEPWQICAFAAKWIDGEYVNGEYIAKTLPDYRCKDDRYLVRDIWKLLNQADIVIAHNGDQFDLRKIRSRLIVHKFSPPAPFKTIDTKKVAKRVFGFTSNSLNDLCSQLGIGEKTPTGGFDLWKRCMNGDSAAWEQMRAYNVDDVKLLEQLYLQFRPYINNHPPTIHGEGCQRCGSKLIQWRGIARTTTREYKRFQCQTCGGWGRTTKSEQTAITASI